MTCAEAKRVLLAHADGRLPPARRSGLQTHLDECEMCRAEAERIGTNSSYLTDRLGRLPGLAASAPAFLTELLAPTKHARKAEKQAKKQTATDEVRSRPTLPLAWIVAVLFLVAAAVAIWLLTRDAPAAPRSTGDAGEKVREPSTGRGRETDRGERPRSTPPAPVRPETAPEDPPERPPTPVPAGPRFPAAEKGYVELVTLFARRPTTDALDRLRRAYGKRPARVDPFLELLRGDAEAGERALLVLALTPARDEVAVLDELTSRIGDDGAPEVRSAAAAALATAALDAEDIQMVRVLRGVLVPVGAIRDHVRLDRLLSAAESERDPTVLAQIVRLLGPTAGEDRRVEDRLSELAESAGPVVSAAAAEALDQAGPLTIAEALTRARDRSLPMARRVRAVESLHSAENAVDLLREFTADEAQNLKIAALKGLGNHWDDGGDRLVIEALRGRNPEKVRMVALAILSSKNGQEVLSVLQEVATDESEPELSRAAKEALRLKEEMR